jgi:hypothetical protein
LPLLNTGTTANSFHAAGKYCCVRFKLKICLRIGIKITEQPFMIKPGISSSPTDWEGFADIRMEIGARNKNSEEEVLVSGCIVTFIARQQHDKHLLA